MWLNKKFIHFIKIMEKDSCTNFNKGKKKTPFTCKGKNIDNIIVASKSQDSRRIVSLK